MKRKNKLTIDFDKKISEFYLLPSIVFYKNSNIENDVKWYNVRVNLFLSQLDFTYYVYSK